MAEHDILNPTPTHPLNFDYGFQKKRPITHVALKANQGSPFYREMSDIGHQFSLNWAERDTKTAQSLKRYYEQYRDGFFTLIDHEDGGRQYVGRFTTPVEPVPVSNNKWTVQGVSFDEIPGAPMLKYPNRWDRDAIWRYCRSDFNELKVTFSGAWTIESSNQVAALTKSGIDVLAAGTANDWCSMAYVGYGFQFWARRANTLGIANLYLDGALVQPIDFYAAVDPSVAVSSMLVQQVNVPLGLHVVQLVCTGTRNAASSGSGVIWDALKVMR